MTSQNDGGDIASGQGDPEVDGPVSDTRAEEMLQRDQEAKRGEETQGSTQGSTSDTGSSAS